MRIVHIIDYFKPKLGYQETFLAKKHIEMGFDVWVLTSNILFSSSIYKNIDKKNNKINSGIYKEEGINVLRLDAIFELFSRVWLKNLKKELNILKPDVIFVHGIYSVTAVRIALWKLANKKNNVFLGFDSHMAEVMSANRLFYPVFRFIYKNFLKNIILKASDTKIIAVANVTKDYMMKNYYFKESDIIVIPLGVDISLFRRDLKNRYLMRKKYNIEEDELVFIYVGKIMPKKGLGILLEASSLLLKRKLKFKLVILGMSELSYLDELKLLVKNLNLGKNVLWIDFVPNNELPKYYSIADIGVWPSHVSITRLEAMGCELPIIVNYSNVSLEWLKNDNGLTYDEGNVNELSEKMYLLGNNKRLRYEMGKRGRELVENEFSWDEISKKFLDLVHGKLLKRKEHDVFTNFR